MRNNFRNNGFVVTLNVILKMARTNMLMVIYLVAAVLPWTIVEGRKGCWASSSPPGDECLYGTVINGSPDMQIRYYFTSKLTRICCEAYRCQYWHCSFVYVGCGQSVNTMPFQTDPLAWEVRDVEPIMRCYDSRGLGAYYSYTVEPYASG